MKQTNRINMMTPVIAILIAVAVIGMVGFQEAAAQADYVIHNAHVYTMNPDQPTAEAIAVRGERILMVGSDDQVLDSYPDAERRDAGQLHVIPGLIDAHAHLMGRGLSLLQADLVGTSSKDAVVERLRDHEQRMPDDAWLTGRGWDQNDWPELEYPTRADLDTAFPDRPVWIERIDGHAAWANTAALIAAGLDQIRDADDPQGGRILRGESGEPTGIFIDAAMNLVSRSVPEPTDEARVEALRRVLEETARYGLTGIHDAGIELKDLELYRRAMKEGWFGIRLYGMISGLGATFQHFCNVGPMLSDQLTVRSVKFYIDGALGSRGAALLEPYSDEPGTAGLLQIPPAAFTENVKSALRCGFQVNTHAIGDRGTRVVLDAYQQAINELGLTSGRHRIEHAQIVHPDDIARFREIGVIASMQPTHATSDMYWAADRLGQDRLEGAYSWRSFLDEGVKLAFGSDFPVENVSPLLGFYAAVTRQDADGYPEGGWLPDEILTREEALKAFTLDAAYAAFQENDLGSIEPGKFADFVVLSKDLMTIPMTEILTTHVIATYLNGKRIYQREDTSDAQGR
jgi:hypothetical protein